MTDSIWIWFADNGNIRKWSTEPFEEGTEFLATTRSALPVGVKEQLNLAEYMLTKDSLCDSERIDEGLSVIRRILSALTESPAVAGVTDTCKCDPVFHEYHEDGVKHCRSCDAEWHPTASLSSPAEGETTRQKPGRAAQAQAGEKPDFPADEQSGETSLVPPEASMTNLKDLQARLKEAAEDAKQLEVWLNRYGGHARDCQRPRGPECDCGWDELRAARNIQEGR